MTDVVQYQYVQLADGTWHRQTKTYMPGQNSQDTLCEESGESWQQVSDVRPDDPCSACDAIARETIDIPDDPSEPYRRP